MKQFENKVLFILDEEMLEEVQKLILDAGFLIDKETFFLSEGDCLEANYLIYLDNSFGLSYKWKSDQEITLEQFKELLKQ